MALYEYVCESCEKGRPYRFEVRMPMRDVVQFTTCPQCGKQAQKVFGSFALTGIAQPGYGDGAAPWDPTAPHDDDELGMDDPMMGHGHDHGHSHGPADFGLDDDF